MVILVQNKGLSQLDKHFSVAILVQNKGLSQLDKHFNVVILVQNKGLSQLDKHFSVVVLVRNQEKGFKLDGPELRACRALLVEHIDDHVARVPDVLDT